MLALIFAGCTNSGLGLPPETAATGDSGSTVSSGPCPWVGAWTLVSVGCGAFPYDGWFVDHDAATMSVTEHPSGGCAAEITVTGDDCTRIDAWRITAPTGVQSDAFFEGVTSCEPEACTFSADETSCLTGGGTDLGESIQADDTSGDLVLERVIADTAPGCSLDVLTTWVR